MTTPTTTLSPPTCIPFQRRYPAHPASVSRARHSITDAIDHGLLGPATARDPDLTEALRLLASELVTNAITHSASEPDDLIEVTLWIADRHLWLAVTDHGARLPIRRMASPSSTHGRGLELVEALASIWGTLPRREGTGKVVFAGLPVSTLGAVAH